MAYITTMFASDIRYGLSKSEQPERTEELTTAVNMCGFSIIADRLFGQAVGHAPPISLLVIECNNLKDGGNLDLLLAHSHGNMHHADAAGS